MHASTHGLRLTSCLLACALVATGCGGGKKSAAPECLCGGTCDASGACVSCDTGLALGEADPATAAKALGICHNLVEAKWVLPDGSAPASADAAAFGLGHGLLSSFGPNVSPREGARMLVLSSGTARAPADAGYQSVSGFDKGYSCGSPAGFPKESPSCPGVTTGQPHDGAGLELKLTAPGGATGFSFDYKFYTFEWPDYICSTFNDLFVAILSPVPIGQTDGNIVFDALGNPMSVNNGNLDVCGCLGGPPCTAGGKTFSCPLGTAELVGTGFDEGTSHGATGWLTASAAVTAGATFTLRLAIYDSGDGVLDSTVLVDNFRWTR